MNRCFRGEGGICPRSMIGDVSLHLPIGWLCAVLLLLSPSDSLLGNSDGPVIGVQIHKGTGEIPIVAGPGGMLVEWPGNRKDFSAGTYSLRLTREGATVGDLDFGREIPFRFRGSKSSLNLGEKFYEGWLEIDLPKAGAPWKLVNRLPIEKYLLGVLPGEMPVADYPAAALAAQAIAARSYALFQIMVRPPEARIHLYSDTRSQMYIGGGLPHPRAREAVDSTRGLVLTHEGRIFECFYHSTCGGGTRSAADCFGGDSIPSMVAVKCAVAGGESRSLVGACKGSKYHRWDVTIGEDQLRQALAPICARHRIDLGEILALEPVDPSLGGHCSYVRVRHQNGTFEVDADRLRQRCREILKDSKKRLRSTSFIGERRGREFVFYGRGWGHGVGLCQVGAKGHAERGLDFRQILQHYYSGVELTPMWK